MFSPSFSNTRQLDKAAECVSVCVDRPVHIKGLVGPRHFEIFAEPNKKFKALFKAITYMLGFVGPFFQSFNLRRPHFSRRPYALCLVCLMVNPSLCVDSK